MYVERKKTEVKKRKGRTRKRVEEKVGGTAMKRKKSRQGIPVHLSECCELFSVAARTER